MIQGGSLDCFLQDLRFCHAMLVLLGCFLPFWPFNFDFDVFGFPKWGSLVILGGRYPRIRSNKFRTPSLVGGRIGMISLLVTCSFLFGI